MQSSVGKTESSRVTGRKIFERKRLYIFFIWRVYIWIKMIRCCSACRYPLKNLQTPTRSEAWIYYQFRAGSLRSFISFFLSFFTIARVDTGTVVPNAFLRWPFLRWTAIYSLLLRCGIAARSRKWKNGAEAFASFAVHIYLYKKAPGHED